MKKALLTLVLICIAYYSFAQWTTSGSNIYNSNIGYVGVNTATPQSLLHIYQSAPDATGFIIQGHTINTDAAMHYVAMTFDGDYGNATGNYSQIRSYSNLYETWGSHLAFFTTQTGVANTLKERMRIDWYGNVGIGTTSPAAKLHILDNGSSSNASSEYSGDLIVQGNSGSRTATGGASLEFVIPANTDGSNPWGQARIITVAGNANNGDATGRLILGTRRLFDKGTGTGLTWNYGDDLIIDGNGFVGINTSDTKGYNFAVNGKVIATSMTVKLNQNWPDYVFKPKYQLPSLQEVKTYIDLNHHLPDMPSEQEVIKDGINLGEMNKLLTKKVEELTLYLIEKDKTEKQQQEKISSQEERISKLEQSLDQLLKSK